MRLINVIFILLLLFVFGCGQSDKEAYERAKLKDTIEGYQEFIQKYPKSEFRTSARNGIKEIKDKEARTAYKYAKLKDTIEGYEKFIKKYPGNELQESARNQIKKIKEKEAHESALSAPCYGIKLGTWEYLKRNYEWEPHRYRALIRNNSNRNKLVFFKYKLKGDDTWYPVTEIISFFKTHNTSSGVAFKLNSGDVTTIEIKIETNASKLIWERHKFKQKNVEKIEIDYCK